MNRDDIIRMAREAGMMADGEMWFSPGYENCDVDQADLERFAQLVAAAEREACAEIAHLNARINISSKGIAEAIRARGQQ